MHKWFRQFPPYSRINVTRHSEVVHFKSTAFQRPMEPWWLTQGHTVHLERGRAAPRESQIPGIFPLLLRAASPFVWASQSPNVTQYIEKQRRVPGQWPQNSREQKDSLSVKADLKILTADDPSKSSGPELFLGDTVHRNSPASAGDTGSNCLRRPNTPVPGSVPKALVWRAVQPLALTVEASRVILTCGQGYGSLSGLTKLLPLWPLLSFACVPFPRPDSCGLGASAVFGEHLQGRSETAFDWAVEWVGGRWGRFLWNTQGEVCVTVDYFSF